MSESFDVIVAGAGPAGSSCARRAAELGLSVTVLEKSAFPRSEPCGAGLTERSLRLLNGEQTPVERVVQAALAASRLQDLTVEDPPMEEIIRAIYADAERGVARGRAASRFITHTSPRRLASTSSASVNSLASTSLRAA